MGQITLRICTNESNVFRGHRFDLIRAGFATLATFRPRRIARRKYLLIAFEFAQVNGAVLPATLVLAAWQNA